MKIGTSIYMYMFKWVVIGEPLRQFCLLCCFKMTREFSHRGRLQAIGLSIRKCQMNDNDKAKVRRNENRYVHIGLWRISIFSELVKADVVKTCDDLINIIKQRNFQIAIIATIYHTNFNFELFTFEGHQLNFMLYMFLSEGLCWRSSYSHVSGLFAFFILTTRLQNRLFSLF